MSLFTKKKCSQPDSEKSTALLVMAYTVEAVIGTVAVGYIFYDNIIIGGLFLWLVPVYVHMRRKGYIKKKRQKLAEQFMGGMNSVAVALSAGYSVENAFIEAAGEVAMLYGGKSEMTCFFARIQRQLAVNRNIEEIIEEFAMTSGVEDIMLFAEVFAYAKRSGGNMVEIINDTISIIGQKADTAREIFVLISAKQLEQYIMDVVPVAIVMYLRLTSMELMERMYGNVTGVVVMTVCLVVYFAAILISFRIVDIRV